MLNKSILLTGAFLGSMASPVLAQDSQFDNESYILEHQPSEQMQLIMHYMETERGERNYSAVDKDGIAYFVQDNEIVFAVNILLGRSLGDAASFGTDITPAGVHENIRLTIANDPVYGQYIVDFKCGVQQDTEGPRPGCYSFHEVIDMDNRLTDIFSPIVLDRRETGGCVNTPVGTMKRIFDFFKDTDHPASDGRFPFVAVANEDADLRATAIAFNMSEETVSSFENAQNALITNTQSEDIFTGSFSIHDIKPL